MPTNQPDQTIFHQHSQPPVTFNIKLEKNSKGYNWEITVINAPSVEVAMQQITMADNRLRQEYGAPTKDA